MSKSTSRSAASSRPKTTDASDARRRAFVFISLVLVLTFTSVLLLTLAPKPLQPGTTTLMHTGK
jgi:competence protein ComGC